MLSLEIRVDTSLPPHSFLVVVGPDGVERGYGFAPNPSGMLAQGQVRDDTRHPADVFSGKIEITQAQYDSLMNYISATTANPPVYAAFYGSECSTWVVNALAQMGMVPALGVPDMQPSNILVDFVESLIFNPWMQATGIEESKFLSSIQNLFHQAEITRSPLVLDLNGDGVSTVAKSAGVHFDQNNNRFSELTGWVDKDDGLLVRDLNNNGQIDGGGELFGDNKSRVAGAAADGFAALAQEDKNTDGVVNAQDANFTNFRVWQDLNQDGVSQAGELKSVNERGIASIKVAKTEHGGILHGGSAIADIGSFTRTEGATSIVAEVNFASDTFHRSFIDVIPTTPQSAVLPDMHRSGVVNSVLDFECNSSRESVIH